MKEPQKSCTTAVLLVVPETGCLPGGMGPLARYVSSKCGGLGEVVAAICEGLALRGVEYHLATLNLRRRFQREANLTDDAWQEVLYTVDPGRIHLIESAAFSELNDAYEGNSILNAAEFQKSLVNHVIVPLRAMSGGKLIIHSHDWMAGGIVTAYARMSGCPVLHTVHNSHTGHIPQEMYFGVDMGRLRPYIYFSDQNGSPCVDSQATAIKNASIVSFVGDRFLKEIVEGRFDSDTIVPTSVRNEVKIKYDYGSTAAVLNAPSPALYPERCEHLVRNFGPNEEIMTAKAENRKAFQMRTGLRVDPEAILLYWPSRLDPFQKGIRILEEIAHRFVIVNGDVQIAIIGNGVGGDRNHEEICGRIAWSSNGKIVYHRFDEPLSMLGFAAAADVFGASLYEPCGLIDQIGNLFGATATNRDTGGYHEKIRELLSMDDGAPQDEGNGFLFRDYDAGGLWYGLESAVRFHRKRPAEKERHLKRIMTEARERYNLCRMVDGYAALYERLNGGRPLELCNPPIREVRRSGFFSFRFKGLSPKAAGRAARTLQSPPSHGGKAEAGHSFPNAGTGTFSKSRTFRRPPPRRKD